MKRKSMFSRNSLRRRALICLGCFTGVLLVFFVKANPRPSTHEQFTSFSGSPFTPAGTPTQAWIAYYNGPGNAVDQAKAIAVDNSGNVYVTGRSNGGPSTDFDYATVKYNSAGQQEWAARYNGPDNGEDHAQGIAVDRSGNVYITGASVGEYATIKYDSTGQEQWVARYGSQNGASEATALAIDSFDNVYVTGWSAGPDGSADYTTIKYNSAGQQQ